MEPKPQLEQLTDISGSNYKNPKPGESFVWDNKPQRTISQNRCLHLALTQISTLLVEQGLDQRTIIRDLKGYSAPVTPEFLKLVFKTIMWTMYRKESTTTLTTVEMMDCFDVFALFLSQTYGITVEWPSNDSLALQALLDSQN